MSEVRAIDADKLMAMFRYPIDYSAVYVRKMIDAALTIDTVRHARWIEHRNVSEGEYDECTACGFEAGLGYAYSLNYAYCPSCGAKMDTKEDTPNVQ